MLETLKREWRKLRDAPSGERFTRYYEDRRASGAPRHPLVIVPALLIVLLGVVMLPAPGPGALVIALGLGLLARESRRVAGGLDRAETIVRDCLPVGWRWR